MWQRMIFAGAAFLAASCDWTDGAMMPLGPIEEPQFAARWAETWCDRQSECDEGRFLTTWRNESECVDTKEEVQDFRSEWNDLICDDYDASAAAACVQAMGGLSCDDWEAREWRNECRRVYGCE